MRSRWSRAFMLLLVAVLSLPFHGVVGAESLQNNWQTVRGSEGLWSLAWGNGRYVGIGQGDTVRLSPDGLTWTRYELPAGTALSAIIFGAGKFVGLSKTGVLSSVDGQTWTQRFAVKEPRRLWVIGDRFWAATEFRFYTSADGENWSEVRQSPPGELVGGPGHIIGLGAVNRQSFSAHVTFSGDGLTWEEVSLGEGIIPINAAYGNGRFLVQAMRSFKELALFSSVDGHTWTEQGLPAARGSIRFADGQFRIITYADGTIDSYQMLSSADGVTWKGTPFGTTDDRLTYLGGYWWEMGDAPRRSRDGQTWVMVDEHLQGELNGAIWGNGQWVAVGQLGTVLTSTDGLYWRRRETGTDANLRGVVWENGRFVAWTDSTFTVSPCKPRCSYLVLTSADGRNWEQVETGYRLRDLVSGNGLILADDAGNGLRISTDGVHWDLAESKTSGKYRRGLQFGLGRFWAWNYDYDSHVAIVSSSTDGRTWAEQRFPADPLEGMRVGGGQIILYPMHSKTAYLSTDGMTWSTGSWQAQGMSNPDVAWGAGRWYATTTEGGQGTQLWSAKDGMTWQKAGTVPEGYARDLKWGGGQFIATGPGGFIMRLPMGVGASTCQSAFSDLPATHLACQAVNQLVDQKVIGGYPDGTFGAERSVTRAEFAKMLVTARGWQVAPGSALPFSDGQGHWATTQGYLQAVLAKGALGGFPDGTIQPDAPLTRAQLVKVTVAAMGLVPAGSAGFADVAATDWFDGWVGAARSARLIGSRALTPLWRDGAFEGDWPATRAEAAVILSNLLRY